MKPTVLQDTPALAIDNITKKYCQWQRSGNARDIIKNLIHPEKRVVTALDRISLRIKKGEFVAYAGANGAGKSTTIKILSGILMPTEGTVSVLGFNPAKDRIKLMRHIGVLFGQRTELWWDHPVISSFEWEETGMEHTGFHLPQKPGDGYGPFRSLGHIKNLFQRIKSGSENAGGYCHASSSQSRADFS